MAGLINELVNIMSSENDLYKELIPIASRKTRVIIDNDLNALQEITDKEQLAIEKINAEGDAHVSFYRLPTCTGAELALGHPTAEAYASRVEGLVNAIKAATGWDGGAIADTVDTVVTDDSGRTEDITTDAPGTSGSGDSPAGGCSSAAGTAAAAAAAAATFGMKLTGRRKRKKEKDAD